MSVPRRVLQLDTSVWFKPYSGGQRRSAALTAAYRRAGWEVMCIGLYDLEHTPPQDIGPTDLPLPPSAMTWIREHTVMWPLFGGLAAADDPHIQAALAHLIDEFQPEVVHYEHPYMPVVVEGVLRRLPRKPLVVYSSHNVESPMYEQILVDRGANQAYIDEVCGIVQQLETRLVNESDLVLAVTEKDKREYEAMGEDVRVLVVPNGIDKYPVDPVSRLRQHSALSQRGVTSLAMFVGSDWQPNVRGFLELVGMETSWLPPGALVRLAGSVGTAVIEQAGELDPAHGMPFWNNVDSVGWVDDADLTALLDLADVVLLPVLSGGGSNLKTAEALLSEKKIVATSFAMKGFEEFLDMPQLWIADSPEDFRRAMAEALSGPPVPLTPEQQARVRTVTWENHTPHAVTAVAELLDQRD